MTELVVRNIGEKVDCAGVKLDSSGGGEWVLVLLPSANCCCCSYLNAPPESAAKSWVSYASACEVPYYIGSKLL